MGNVKYLSLINSNKNIDLVEVLCSFHDQEFNSDYLIYSLNKNSDNNKNVIHIGKIINVDDRQYLFNIDNYEEWAKINNIIKNINRYGLEGDINERL